MTHFLHILSGIMTRKVLIIKGHSQGWSWLLTTFWQKTASLNVSTAWFKIVVCNSKIAQLKKLKNGMTF